MDSADAERVAMFTELVMEANKKNVGSTTMLGTRCVRHECFHLDMVGAKRMFTGAHGRVVHTAGVCAMSIGMFQGTQKISARGGDTMPVNFREGPCHGGYGVGPQKLPEGPGSSSSRKGATLKLRSPKDSSVHRERSLYHRHARAGACQQLQRPEGCAGQGKRNEDSSL